MTRRFIFADEAGCLTFQRKQNVSRYFIVCTVIMTDCAVQTSLLELRRRLAWEATVRLGEYFHATEDEQAVRDQVFSTISQHDFTVQATIMEKSKAQPHITSDKSKFYKYGWYYHFKHGVAKRIPGETEALVTAAAIGTRKERAAFTTAIHDVLDQTMLAGKWKTDFPPASSDPCVQVADYCAWAIQRKYERGDTRSYDLIRDRVNYCYDLWQAGNKFYY